MTTVPRQPSSPDDEESRRAAARRRVIRRRALTLLTIVLLIGIPAGYLVISANQSRNSGKDKEAKYSATGLTIGWPSKVQRRLYEIPIPAHSRNVAYYETNNYKVSRLYAQFLTSDKGLDSFLEKIDSDASDLKRNVLPISDRDRSVAGWNFSGPGPWYGLTHDQPDPKPTQSVVVNRSNPDHPMVYVVSTTEP
ncbi:sugar kinase [Streptomyces sp. KL116D]|uniref:sugar kinase n=1 Tax=Streptomyces sp. KL116D TaxID=3045152 RepID=UPI0035583628